MKADSPPPSILLTTGCSHSLISIFGIAYHGYSSITTETVNEEDIPEFNVID
jgi:hypothetical protein